MCLLSLTSITSFMTGVHLERLYFSSWERSRRVVLRELNNVDYKRKVHKKWKKTNDKSAANWRSIESVFSCSAHTDVMIGTPSSFQFRINSRSSSIFTCWMSLFKFSSVVPVSVKNSLLGLHPPSQITSRKGLGQQRNWPLAIKQQHWCTIEAEDVEQHCSDLVIGAVLVEQHRQQGSHGIFHFHPVNIWPHRKVLHGDKTLLICPLSWEYCLFKIVLFLLTEPPPSQKKKKSNKTEHTRTCSALQSFSTLFEYCCMQSSANCRWTVF